MKYIPKTEKVDYNNVVVIKKVVAEFFNLSPEELTERTNKRVRVIPRQIFHERAKHYTDLTLAEIGFLGGRKDHATVLHSVKVVNNFVIIDKKYKSVFAAIDWKIKEALNLPLPKNYFRTIDDTDLKELSVLSIIKAVDEGFYADEICEQYNIDKTSLFNIKEYSRKLN